MMKEKIISIIKGIKNGVELSDDTHLIFDGVLSSMEIVQLIMALEQSFGVKISVDEIMPENFDTVDAIQGMLEKLSKK